MEDNYARSLIDYHAATTAYMRLAFDKDGKAIECNIYDLIKQVVDAAMIGSQYISIPKIVMKTLLQAAGTDDPECRELAERAIAVLGDAFTCKDKEDGQNSLDKLSDEVISTSPTTCTAHLDVKRMRVATPLSEEDVNKLIEKAEDVQELAHMIRAAYSDSNLSDFIKKCHSNHLLQDELNRTNQLFSSEISVDAETLSDVVDEYLHWRKVNPHIKGGENYLKRLRAATSEPVSVSLEKCAKDLRFTHAMCNQTSRMYAKAVLDSAGVPHVD